MPDNRRKIAFHTLGCKLNFSETSTIARSFCEKEFERVEFEEIADVYVLNTCSVTDNADKKCRSLVRRVLSQSPNAVVAVTGCYAQLKPEEIAAIPGVDLVFGTSEKFNISEQLRAFEKNYSAKIFREEIKHCNTFFPSFSAGDRTRAFLKVQDGCDYFCSFCTIPLARGRSRSDSVENTLASARKAIGTGAHHGA
jgi:threonylcarbamoyladenosine tRNA methylthiotransferase MtaB